jgi:hypothetical protein
MANELAKFLNSQRRQRDQNAVNKQVRIAKAAGIKVDKPNKFAKHHAMDCGNPKCYLCGNPRKTHKDKLTAQEKRLFQDIERTTDKHSNGLKPTED